MAVNTGKSNAKWIRVFVENSSGGDQDISAAVTNVNIPINYSNEDVTGFSDGVINVSIGHPAMNVTMDGVFSNTASTGAHTVLSDIVGKTDDDSQNSPYTVTVQIGIRKAPMTGDPEFEGVFLCTEYNVNGDLTWNASFQPGSGTAPAWGTATV